jgi:hypothetical protein
MGIISAQTRAGAHMTRAGRHGAHEYYVCTGVVKEPTVALHSIATAGAKTVLPSGRVTYATASTVPVTPPAAANIISFIGGKVEIAGSIYDLDTTKDPNENINLDDISKFLTKYSATKLGPEYVIAAVPRYNEPLSLSQAQALGVRYTVGPNNINGEYIATYHPDPTAQQALTAYNIANPGEEVDYFELVKRRQEGTISANEARILRVLAEAQEELSDGRKTGVLLEPVGVSFVVASIQESPNYASGSDIFLGSDSEFRKFFGRYVGDMPAKLLRPTLGYYSVPLEATVTGLGYNPLVTGDFYVNNTSFTAQKVGSSGAPGTKLGRIKTVEIYETAAEAAANINGLTITLSGEDKVAAFEAAINQATAPTSVGGLGWATVFANAYEYYAETYNDASIFKAGPSLKGYINRENVHVMYGTTLEKGFLGHLNRIYLDNTSGSNIYAAQPEPKAGLTYYADPCPLIKIRIGNCDPVLGTASIDTADLWAQGGTAAFEPVYGQFPTTNLL